MLNTTNAHERLSLDDLISIDGLAEQYPAVINVPRLRWYLRHRRQNGLARACIPLGKRLLISKSRFEEWLATRFELES